MILKLRSRKLNFLRKKLMSKIKYYNKALKAAPKVLRWMKKIVVSSAQERDDFIAPPLFNILRYFTDEIIKCDVFRVNRKSFVRHKMLIFHLKVE